MSELIDITGNRYGRWTVLSIGTERRAGQRMWACRCDCGTERLVSGANLRNGTSRECGCGRGENNLSHGHAQRGNRSNAYRSWRAMKQRTLNPNCPHRYNYADRGIGIDPKWMNFESFLADMGECAPGLSLDRIDNNRGYEPGNCRWANQATQSRNTRRNIFVLLRGERMILKDAARSLGVTDTAVYQRMKRNHLDAQSAIDAMASSRL